MSSKPTIYPNASPAAVGPPSLEPPITVASLFAEGVALHNSGRLADAENLYNRVLGLEPNHFGSLHLLGVICDQRGDHEEAVRRIDLALKQKPNDAPALNNRGLALEKLGRLQAALASYNRALELRPDLAMALANRGNVLSNLRRFRDALASYDRALELQPKLAVVHIKRGDVLNELRRFRDALVSYDRAVELRPSYAEAHINRGNALLGLRRFEDALASYDRAVQLRPDHAVAHYNRGNALQELTRFEDALASYDRALELRPDSVEAYTNSANALVNLRRFEDALASYDRALKQRPRDGDVHYNAALCRLLVGDFTGGWQEHEWRWEAAQLRAGKRTFPRPLWLGADDIKDKTILLHAEQGFGDTLQFCRYVPLVAERAAHVVLEVQKPLHDIMSTLRGGAQIVSKDDSLPDFDLHCPLLSLPLAFGTRLETIPSQTPYLSAEHHKCNAWRGRLGRHDLLRIGLVWASDPQNPIDRQRSLHFDQLAPILQVRGCDFYSLQKGDHAVAQLHNSALSHRVVDWSAELRDFSDTAALMANLDLVIAVDTAVAHLAGALGKPFWLLNRYNTCWRWLLDREDSPWYPTAGLFRQDATRDWRPVIARVAATLQDYVCNF